MENTKASNSNGSRRGLGVDLKGINRTWSKRTGTLFVYAWHGAGAPQIGKYKGKNRAEAERAEREDSAGLAGRYSDAVGSSVPHLRVFAGVIARYREWMLKHSDLADSTKELRSIYLDEINEVFGECTTREMQAQGIRGIIKGWLRSMEHSPGKREACQGTLSTVYTWAVDEEIMHRSPMKGIAHQKQASNRAHMIWSVDQVELVAQTCPEALQRAIWLLWHTGLRTVDLCKLNWNHIHWDKRLIIKRCQKNSVDAYIPITDDLEILLRQCPKVSTHVVTNTLGQPYKNEKSFQKTLLKKIRKAGISDLTLHDLRGTRATHVFASGVSDADAEKIMGWASGRGGKMRGTYGDPDTLGIAAANRLRAKG
ncbi:MAG: tyrosine-type recombinase/integrase [Pseudomonadota bacterium]